MTMAVTVHKSSAPHHPDIRSAPNYLRQSWANTADVEERREGPEAVRGGRDVGEWGGCGAV
ncbi:hypothetical protein E2C01_055723 [Portunus trituberculatus]|uniref:Uncharacterized protein n=1 Tax=Portunus trituberculatus TaxID=210409 RepID=A0A5B7GVT3_PORTR|nr:hypothetical protein [Portunus trituberculatus]